MNNEKIFRNMLIIVAVSILTLGPLSAAFGHGKGVRITPEATSVSAGSQLKVKVNGLTGTKEATFALTGIDRQYDLGTFSISKDDFDRVLQIPGGLSTGSYRLTVKGGGKSATAVISVTALPVQKGLQEKEIVKETAPERTPDKHLEEYEATEAKGHDESIGRPIALRIIRPGWLKIVVAVLVLLSTGGGVWLLVIKP
jgi:hypothetical protein